MHKHNDAYGTCPRCKYVGWHRYKKKALIYCNGNKKIVVSLFKCPQCGKKFGFNLSEDIPIPDPKRVKYNDLYNREEDEKDEPEYYKITPDEIVDIAKHLDEIIKCVDYGDLGVNTGGSILHSIASIRKVIHKIAGC